MTLSGPEVTGIRVGQARLRGRIVGGALSLGSIDRLTPPSSGKPFALPALDADLSDVRIRLETPLGLVGAKLSGRGRLDDGFRGQLALASDGLAMADCRADRLGGAFAIRIAAARPTITGPMRAALLDCGSGRLAGASAELALTLGAALDRWQGRATLAADRADGGGVVGQRLGGTVTFAGDARATTGNAAIEAGVIGMPQAFAATGGRIVGDWRIAGGAVDVTGRLDAAQVAAGRRMIRDIARMGLSAEGTPVGPLARRLGDAVAAMARGSRVETDIAVAIRRRRGSIAAARSARDGPLGQSYDAGRRGTGVALAAE